MKREVSSLFSVTCVVPSPSLVWVLLFGVCVCLNVSLYLLCDCLSPLCLSCMGPSASHAAPGWKSIYVRKHKTNSIFSLMYIIGYLFCFGKSMTSHSLGYSNSYSFCFGKSMTSHSLGYSNSYSLVGQSNLYYILVLAEQ